MIWLEDFRSDAGFAVRQLRKNPGFTAVAVLSLALGIGANTAVFTLIESTLLRPISIHHLDRLRLLTWREQWGGWVPPNVGFQSPTFGSIYEQRITRDGGLMHAEFTPPLYREFQKDNTSFESLVAFKELGRVTAVVDGGGEALNCFLVSSDFYRGLDITPVIGQGIGTANDAVVISYAYWTRRFARSPSVIGKKIMINGVPMAIVGVNPEYFTGIEPGAQFEIWAPLTLPPAILGRSLLDEARLWSLPLMGRLKAGVTDAKAQDELDAIFQAKLDAEYPGRKGAPPKLLVQAANRGVDYLTPRYDTTLIAAFALAGFVLLIACMNVANLLLAKSAARQREISMKLALGAGKGRIVRQLLTEGLLLASLAGAVGVVLGRVAQNAIPALLATPWRPSFFDPAFDWKVLLISFGITLLTGVLFSLAPVWQSRRVEVNDALKDGGRATAGLSKLRTGRVLVVLQAALSLLLVVAAGTCVKTFANLRDMPLGLHPQGVLLLTLEPPLLRYPAYKMGLLLSQLQERLGQVPGVQSASFIGTGAGTSVEAFSSKTLPPGFNTYAYGNDVGSQFFETMGIPILQGRPLNEHDIGKALRAVVVNQEFGRHFFGREDIVGETFNGQLSYGGYGGSQRGYEKAEFQIVGVCADWKMDQFRDKPRAGVYTAAMQAPRAGRATFVVKISGNEASAIQQIREAVRTVDPGLAIADVHTMEEHIENGLAQERLLASLAMFFGGLALILASIGIYGVMAYATARRTSEIGVRMALGARPERIAWMVLRETLLLAAVAILLAVPAAVAMGPLLDKALAPGWYEGFVYGVKPNDAANITLAVAALGLVGLLAGYLPARRAARTDPATVLRHD